MIFIDRSLPRSVAQALKLVRNDVVWLEDVLRHDARDDDWMQEAGRSGWLAVTRDKRIRTRPRERYGLTHHGVGCFCLIQRTPMTKWECLKVLALTLDDMERIFGDTPRPFLYTVGRTGQIRRIF